MSRFAPRWGQRRGWYVVAAFLAFGVLGGSAGMAVTTPVEVPPALPLDPVVKPVPVPVSLTAPTSTVTKAAPTVVVTTHDVVKVFVTPSSASSPSWSTVPPRPSWTPTYHTTTPPPTYRSTPRDTPTSAPTALPSTPAPTTRTSTSTAPSTPGTPGTTPTH